MFNFLFQGRVSAKFDCYLRVKSAGIRSGDTAVFMHFFVAVGY
jgi:hypothetical protein